MDNTNISMVDFIRRFETFKVDEINIHEAGLVDKLIEMFKMRNHLKKLKSELETKDGLSKDFFSQEGKLIVNEMLFLSYRI